MMPPVEPKDEIDLAAIRWKMLVACDTCRQRKARDMAAFVPSACFNPDFLQGEMRW